mmetsp:Transcript_36793/g.84744  ORF Transcript_36793/g.84744 Transcript_36793/m.84744 type:complete len:340 (+) Transcript_36793:75-1094(+)
MDAIDNRRMYPCYWQRRRSTPTQDLSAFALPRLDEPCEDVCEDVCEDIWDEAKLQYGIRGMLRVRKFMELHGLLSSNSDPFAQQPIKFLILPGLCVKDPSNMASPRKSFTSHTRSQNEEPFHGFGVDGLSHGGAKYVPAFGCTQVISGGAKGQWWQVLPQVEVIIRDSLDLNSAVTCEVQPGHYVKQAGTIEVFVSGQANGLQRMPVFIGPKTGWVTVDATAVGGPRYLRMVAKPRWVVIFQSEEGRGDIVVRRHASLDSDIVAMLVKGTELEQTGPQQMVNGVLRLPIIFRSAASIGNARTVDRNGSSTGWVTCDASSVGGPKFLCSVDTLAELDARD